jgi:hypothetical protein
MSLCLVRSPLRLAEERIFLCFSALLCTCIISEGFPTSGNDRIRNKRVEDIRKPVFPVVYAIGYFNFFTLFEAVDKSMSADKVELINVAFLLENTPIKVIYIELPEFRTSE